MNSEAGSEKSETLNERSWTPIVEGIRNGDPSAVEELYSIFGKGIRFLLWRQFGRQDLDDRLHDIFLMVVQSIQRGELREPERLMGYIRTVVRRQAAGYIEGVMAARRREVGIDGTVPIRDRSPNPERVAIEEQTAETAFRVLKSLPIRDREILTRFYLREETPQQICSELNITQTQFRLTKSRAKARYSELVRRRFSLRTGPRP
jgi:RNA polymerase sigma factor (sigma-70 family)